MPAVRTAPTVNGTPTRKRVTMRMIDASGDLNAVSFTAPADTLAADIETFVAAYAALTNASMYEVSVSDEYVGAASIINTVAADRNSVKDGVNNLFKDVAAGTAYTLRLMAPLPDIFLTGSDTPDLSYAGYPAMVTAFVNLKPTYELDSAQYTERRERSNNPRVSG